MWKGALEEEGVWGKAKGRPSVCRDACNEPCKQIRANTMAIT